MNADIPAWRPVQNPRTPPMHSPAAGVGCPPHQMPAAPNAHRTKCPPYQMPAEVSGAPPSERPCMPYRTHQPKGVAQGNRKPYRVHAGPARLPYKTE